jgi:hypothetical protein
MLLSWLALQGRSPSLPTFLRVLTHCQRSYHVSRTLAYHQRSSTGQHRQPVLATHHQAATWGLPLQLKHMTTAGQQQPLTLKAALRQLYKRVHPDLFVDFPAEQVGELSTRHSVNAVAVCAPSPQCATAICIPTILAMNSRAG